MTLIIKRWVTPVRGPSIQLTRKRLVTLPRRSALRINSHARNHVVSYARGCQIKNHNHRPSHRDAHQIDNQLTESFNGFNEQTIGGGNVPFFIEGQLRINGAEIVQIGRLPFSGREVPHLCPACLQQF
jgi:hypothetical protein